MKRATGLVLVIAIAAIGVASCSAASATGPPEISYGRDICVECGMSIDDQRFAAGYRLADGTEKTFDDLGGLILHQRETGDDLDAAAVWVHDFDTEEWTEATGAHFVPTLSVVSPMGHGILAFSDAERAGRVAHDLGGEVISWDVVLRLPSMNGLVGHHHMADDEMDEDHSDHMDDG